MLNFTDFLKNGYSCRKSEHNISETASLSILRLKGGKPPAQFIPLERANVSL
jgi:hypothetical protein